MPATRVERQDRGPYQPRLPLTATPVAGAAPRRPRVAASSARAGTRRRPAVTGHVAAAPGSGPGRAAANWSDGGWRLDEKTRRAGRQGVAAARAALAGTVRPDNGRQAHAA